MATIASATSSTITSMLATIQTVAHTSQRTINTAAAGLDMLDIYVDSARIRQADKTKIDMANYRQNLILEASLEEARKQKNMKQELQNDNVLTQLFNENFTRLNDLFAETQPQP